MPELKIKTESYPTRCDICHKVDCFDPITNYCSLCCSTDNIIHKQIISITNSHISLPIFLQNIIQQNPVKESTRIIKSISLFGLLIISYKIPIQILSLIISGIRYEFEWILISNSEGGEPFNIITDVDVYLSICIYIMFLSVIFGLFRYKFNNKH